MAQRRRRERIRKRQNRRQLILVGALSAGLLIVSLVICLLIAGPLTAEKTADAAQTAMLPYDAGQPFGTADLTSAQLEQIRRDGRMRVSDGPRGISIGDSLEKILDCFPSYSGEQPENEQILYCAQVFENQNGVSTILPPRGLLTADNDSIIVTLLAPTSPYPAGTLDTYGQYEHVYCIFTIDPDSMTVSAITLGMDQ